MKTNAQSSIVTITYITFHSCETCDPPSTASRPSTSMFQISTIHVYIWNRLEYGKVTKHETRKKILRKNELYCHVESGFVYSY